MKLLQVIAFILIALFFIQCDKDNNPTGGNGVIDISGVYCLNLQNLEMTIEQMGDSVTFNLTSNYIRSGTGVLSDSTWRLQALTQDSMTFTAELNFGVDGQSFSGAFRIIDANSTITSEGILFGNRGECPEYDITNNSVPQFVKKDFTQLNKIEMISKFRSGIGHSFTDEFENCRSMKHYFSPYANFRKNNEVEIYSPVNGTITSIFNDGHGASIGLNNKQIFIRSNEYPAFTFQLFHIDLSDSSIAIGSKVLGGKMLGHARLYYDDLLEYANSFDIAVWVNTPTGSKLISYFETLHDTVFNSYVSRGINSRDDFIITFGQRNNDPLTCSSETFANSGNLENWVLLQNLP
jgi:hypothetical protein